MLEFEDLARRVAVTWQESRRHAEYIGYAWMSDDDRTRAERADTLLRLAADQHASVHERAAAAEQATKILKSIHSVLLPEAALEVIAAQRRLALDAGGTSASTAPGHAEPPGSRTFPP